ncbi:hypothetical protein SAMN05444161_3376 [Rhizobiales bacterium GAS191]|nr:hypothetical protein SAMN05519103_02496 [Rhizobiales bacterium GAS113]SED51705.1 hypothetical protein SAMN05444161_3376 [Rhizobiales bacterium GAS191]
MNRILAALTGAAALVGVAAMPTQASANPIVLAPVAAAAILGGTAVGGTLLGTAVASNARPTYVAPTPVEPAYGPVVAATPTVPVGPGCYYTRARIHGAWHRVQVCD